MATTRSAVLGIAAVAVLGIPSLTPPAAAAEPSTRASGTTGASHTIGALTWNMCGDKNTEGCGTKDGEIDRRVEQVVYQANKHPDLQVLALQEICGARHYPMIKNRLGDNWMGNFWRKPKVDRGDLDDPDVPDDDKYKKCGIPKGNYIGSAVLMKNPSASATRVDKSYGNIDGRRWGAACINDADAGSTPLYACSAHLPPAYSDECGVKRRTLVGRIDTHLDNRQNSSPTMFGADFNINSNNRTTPDCTNPPVGPENDWLDPLRDHSIGINLAKPTTDGGATIDHIFFGIRGVDYERHHATTERSDVSDHHILKGYVTDLLN